MPERFKSINYYLNRPKIKLSLPKKIAKFSECKALCLQTLEIADPPPPRLNIAGYASALIHDQCKFVRFVSI